jgi:outer membrane lipoprotein-sorting protein
MREATITMKKSARWIPAAAIPVAVIAAGIVVPSVAANADIDLPDKSPQQVLALAAGSSGVAFSGTVEQSSDLGLPDVPAGMSSGGSGDATSQALELLTGSHTAQVFADGGTRQRVQVVEDLAERNVIRDGSDVWTYDSSSKEATHLTLPAPSEVDAPESFADGTEVPKTPGELADAVLDAVDDTTTVTSSDDVSVAGRDAYQVVLTPDDADTLVGRAVLTVDAETGVPLKVVVEARGQSEPAIAVGFSAVSFETPDESVFDFTPPADATVTEVVPPADVEGAETGATPGAHPARTVIGSGWSTIVGLAPAADDADTPRPAETAAPGESAALLDQIMTPVEGGSVLQTSLLSVFLADDGRVFVGAVDADSLVSAAASTPAE